MAVGKVVKYDEARGFGFISVAGGTEDVFLHVNDLLVPESAVRPGVTVVFDVDEGGRGLKASNIRLSDEHSGSAGPGPVRAGSPTSRERVERAEPVDAGYGYPPLGAGEFSAQITELLLAADPPLTGPQILDIRARLLDFAQSQDLLDP